MIFLTKEKALFASDGRFIKHIDCPMATKLARAVSAAAPDQEFHCSTCSNKVKNLLFFTDEQAIEAAQNDTEVCFFATKEATNVVHLSLPVNHEWRSENEYRAGIKKSPGEPWPTIRTARGIEEMNFAIRNGFTVVPRKVDSAAGAQDSIALNQDIATGYFFYLYDWRGGWSDSEEVNIASYAATSNSFPESHLSSNHDASVNQRKRIFNFFTYSKDESVPPVAGYVIPRGLLPGTRVFLEDVIEHLVQSYPQEGAERMPSWWGTWTGTDIVLAKFEQELILG